MVDSKWNRLNLLIKQGELSKRERTELLLNSGLDAFQMDVACVTSINTDNGSLTVTFSSHKDWLHGQYNLYESLCQFTIEHRDILASHNLTNTDLNEHGVIEDLQFSAYLGIPIYVENELYGTLFFASYEPRLRKFSDREQAFLKIMASSLRHLIHQNPVV